MLSTPIWQGYLQEAKMIIALGLWRCVVKQWPHPTLPSPTMPCTRPSVAKILGEFFKIWLTRSRNTRISQDLGLILAWCRVTQQLDDESGLSQCCKLKELVSMHSCHVFSTAVGILCALTMSTRKKVKRDSAAKNSGMVDTVLITGTHLVCPPECDWLPFTFLLRQYIKLASCWWSMVALAPQD